jgi:hypothetical protein
VILSVLCGGFSACGQKGPPLAPIVLTPRAVGELAARKVDNEVVLQFTIPTVNSDNSSPANLRRVEVYAHTGPLPAPADFLKYGTLVASIDVKDPALADAPEPADAARTAPDTEQGAESAGQTAPPRPRRSLSSVSKRRARSISRSRRSVTTSSCRFRGGAADAGRRTRARYAYRWSNR